MRLIGMFDVCFCVYDPVHVCIVKIRSQAEASPACQPRQSLAPKATVHAQGPNERP